MTTADQKRYGIQPTEEEKKREREKKDVMQQWNFFHLKSAFSLPALTHRMKLQSARFVREKKLNISFDEERRKPNTVLIIQYRKLFALVNFFDYN